MKNNFILKLFAWGTAFACVFLLSDCNGKVDQDLIDSITGKTGGVPVTGISLDKASLELKVGDSKTLTATVAPEDATNKNVSWTSGDATIATVENGRVTGVKPGSVTITAKTEDGGRTAECAVTVKTNLAPSVTVGAEHISAVSVVLKGEANLDAQMSSDMTMGIMWSENSGVLPFNSTKIEAKDIDAKEGSTTSYCYSVNLTGLDPEKTYYFRSYVTQNNQDTYGETKSFTTKELSSMIHTEDASNVSAVSAIMNASYDLNDIQYTTKTIGIYYGTSAESLSNTYIAEISATAGAISENWLVLKPATEYFYQAYIILDDKLYKENTKSFTAKSLSSLLSTLDATDIAPTSARMNAKLDLTDVQYGSLSYGFYWGTSEESQTTYVKGGEVAKDVYSALLNNLSHKTQYWYKAYLKVDDQEFYGAVKTFTTDVVPVKGVTLDKTACAVHTIDSTFTLTATITPTDATNKAISWKSSNTSVATVDANGKVTAKGNGSATITVTSTDGRKTAACEVTVAQWVTGITLNKTSVILNEGQTVVLMPTISPSNANDKSVAWSSDNTSVATVDQSGKVTAVSKGTATITATANDGSEKSASCSVTVIRLVSSITLDKTSITIYNGKSATLTATVSPSTASNTGVNWTSSNTSVATVSTSGVVTGVRRGTATITVTAKDGSGVSKTCQVEVKQYVTGLSLDKSSVSLIKGQTETVTLAPSISPSNANDKSVTWTSSNTSVATVSTAGVVTAVSKGTATIKATANDGSGKSASCSVTVIRLVSSITLDKTSITIYNGKSATLTATVSPSTASNTGVNWTSSNTSVATVSTSGVVTGIGRGTATITATAKDGSGKSASCEVKVGQNLSVGSSANCYIVSVPGDYCFRTTKGNSSTSVGSVISAEVLWESYGTSTTPSVGSVINNVSYSNNTITFSTPSTLNNGNAVIAAKDASGNVLWSWHIWVCKDYNPASSAQNYYNNAGTMMDRNLGATSATPGNVGALGLLYQWGRKDPFLGSSSISSSTKAASTLSWPSPVSSSSSNGTIAYATAHPTTFITYNSSNWDWYYTGSSSTDDTRWQSSKAIFDPCPPGWRVPDGGDSGVWSKAVGSSRSFSHTWDSTNKGMNFSGKFGSAGTIWYPAAGCLYPDDGSLYDVGDYGIWWSCTPYPYDDYFAYYLSLYRDGYGNPSGYYDRANGRSVRCLQE